MDVRPSADPQNMAAGVGRRAWGGYGGMAGRMICLKSTDGGLVG